MRLIRIFLCLLLGLVQSHASPRHGYIAPTGASGSAQLNIGAGDQVPANFINVLKTSGEGFNTTSDAGLIDDDGYPTSSPTGNINLTFPSAGSMWSNVQYKLRWDAGVQFSSLNFNFNASACTAVNATIVNCNGGANVTKITSTGGAGSVIFTTNTAQFNIFFGAGGTFSHTAGNALSLYRLSDETDFLAGEIYTPEFKAVLKFASAPTPQPPKTIRFMSWVLRGNANFNGETTWNYRFKPTSLTWAGRRFPPGAWAGSISGGGGAPGNTGVDTYTVTAPDSNTVIGLIANTNSTTTPTLNGITIVNNFGIAPTIGSISVGLATFTFDSLLNLYFYNADGINASIPVEAQAQLANRVNANLWTNVPPWASDDYVTNWATTLCNNTNSSLYLYPEYGNEIWNPGFPQTHWSALRGDALGWSVGSNQDIFGWYGLRVRQIMGNLIPASGCSGHLLRRVMAYQGGGDTTNIANRFEGAQLCPIASGGSCAGNSAYNTLTGSASYNAAPNRPIDVTEVLAFAPYGAGTNLCEGPDTVCNPTAANAPFYQALVTAWEGGQSATSIAMVDTDIRTGTTLSQTVTCSGSTTFTTPLAHGFTSGTDNVAFSVSGGTANSGIAINTLYHVTSTPLSTTFTIQGFVNGFPSGSNINCGTSGSGTVTVGVSDIRNLVNLASTWYLFAESNAALFDGSRGSLAPLRVEQYEGNLEPVGPSAAQCTTLGITGSNCTGSIAAAILAWKADPSSKLTQTAYFSQFMGTDATIPPTFGLMSHSRTPSQLVLPNVCGGGTLTNAGAYALLSDCLPNSTPFQLYNGFAAFRGVP